VSGLRFGRNSRLLAAADFKLVFEAGNRISNDLWVIAWSMSTHPHARLGLAIAKKAAPLAVQRNRLKRIARNVFRLHPLRDQPVDLVVMIRSAAHKAEKPILAQQFSTLFARAIDSMKKRQPPTTVNPTHE
jgi:ribonuclease P protein component